MGYRTLRHSVACEYFQEPYSRWRVGDNFRHVNRTALIFERLRLAFREIVGHVSLYQLRANACIAACRVASYPCVGVSPS